MSLITKVRPYECCGGFFITARLDGVAKGLYMVHFDSQDCLGCHITSLQRNSGIPRALISRACEEVDILAKKKGKKLTHKVVLVNERSQKVLPHLYGEFGYENKGMSGLHLVMTKEYSP